LRAASIIGTASPLEVDDVRVAASAPRRVDDLRDSDVLDLGWTGGQVGGIAATVINVERA